MNEYEIDQTYLDENFINIINILDNDKLVEIVNLLLENFENDLVLIND